MPVSLVGLTWTLLPPVGARDPVPSGDDLVEVIANGAPALRFGTTMLLAGLFLLLWFFVYAGKQVDPVGNAGWMAGVATASGLASLVLMAVHASCVQAAVETSLATCDATVVETIVAVDGVLLLGTLFPFVAAHLLACGVAIIRSAVLPQLVGWVAIGLAGTPLVVPGEVELPALLVWTLILSAGLLVANYPYVGARAGASPHDGV